MSQKSTFFNSLLSSMALVVSDEDVQKTFETIKDEIPFGKLAATAGLAIVKGLGPEVTGHFACQLSYQKLKKNFTHPTGLNHYLSEAIKPAMLQAYAFIERMYLENLKESFADEDLIEQTKEHLKTLKGDLKHWLKDEILENDFLDKPQDALQEITNRMFLYGGYDENDEKWTNLRQYFTENLYAWFDLAFKEALYENDNALKSFQKYLLEEIREQNQENKKLLDEIKNELVTINANQEGKSSKSLKKFLEVEIEKIYEKLNLIHKDIKFLIKLVENLKKEFLERQATQTKTTKNLTPIPTLGIFIGRADDLKRLNETLEKANQVVLVNGVGGIGKTTLAKAYIHQNHKDFDHIAWVSVIGTSIKEAFLNTTYDTTDLQNAQLTQGDTDARFGAIMRVLRQLQGEKNLIVIDNAETDIDDISDELPAVTHWRILLTSRDNLDGYAVLPLDELSPEDALLLFKKYYTGNETDKNLQKLLETINYHTLTIELLAKTLEKSNDEFNLEELLHKLNTRQLNDEKLRKNIKTEHWNAKQTNLFKHLSATFELSNKTEYEIWVLKQFTALPPEPQPIKQLKEWLKIDESNKKDFNKTIEDLHTEGWLKRTRNEKDETCFTLHRLIQDMVHYQHPIVFEDIEALIYTFDDFLYFDESTNFFTKFQYLSPAEYVLNSLPDDVENNVIASLNNNIGIVFKQFDDLKKAVKYLRKSLQIHENQKNDDDIAVAQSNLAIVLIDLADYAGAKNLLEKARISFEKNFGEEHPSTARSYSKLATVFYHLKDYNNAVILFEKTYKVYKNHLGEQHPTTKAIKENLDFVREQMK